MCSQLLEQLTTENNERVRSQSTFPVTHSQLLAGLKCESKWKTTEEGGVGMRSLAHNTLRGRGACWSSGMGLGRIDKLIHSHGLAHNPHKVSQPYFGQVWGWNPTLGKSWDWSPSGLPKTQKTIWKTKTPCIEVFLVSLEKVLKRRYRKCPRILYLDICSPSYGQKKGRESNC